MQSLNNKKYLLESLLESPENENFKCVCISESWLNEEKKDLINFSNYHIATSYCRTKHAGGGVCIVAHNNVEYKVKKEIKNMSIEYVVEMCAIDISEFNLLLITVYWNGRETDIFYSQITLLLNHLIKKYSKKIHCDRGGFQC